MVVKPIFRKIKKTTNKTIIPYVMVILLITKFFGYFKLRVIAQLFGTSRELDIFWASFVIPNSIFNVLVAGSINAAIIPVFSKVLHKDGEQKLAKLFRDVNIVLAVVAFLLGILVFIMAEEAVQLLLGGANFRSFLGVTQQFQQSDLDLLTKLIRMMTLSPIMLGFSSITVAYLRVHKKFLVANLPPLVYNVTLILGAYVLSVYFKLGVVGLAWAVLAGSLFHFLVQLPTLIHLIDGYWRSNRKTEKSGILEHIKTNVKPIVCLAMPRALGVLGEQVNAVFNTMLSFTITEGALSAYKYAFSLHLLPVHILSGALSQVMLTNLSESYTQGRKKKFCNTFNQSLQLTIFLILPFVATFLILRLPIVRLAYGVGAFDWWDTVFTSWSLALLSFAMLAQAVVSITIRAYYAVQETKTPLLVTGLTIVVNLVTTYYAINFFSHYVDWRPITGQLFQQLGTQNFLCVMKEFGGEMVIWLTTRSEYDYAIGGVALGFTLSYLFEMILGLALLNRKVKVVSWDQTVAPFLVKLFLTLLTIISMYVTYQCMDVLFDTTRTVGVIAVFGFTSIVGWSVYLLLSWLFNIEELHYLISRAKILINTLK